MSSICQYIPSYRIAYYNKDTTVLGLILPTVEVPKNFYIFKAPFQVFFGAMWSKDAVFEKFKVQPYSIKYEECASSTLSSTTDTAELLNFNTNSKLQPPLLYNDRVFNLCDEINEKEELERANAEKVERDNMIMQIEQNEDIFVKNQLEPLPVDDVDVEALQARWICALTDCGYSRDLKKLELHNEFELLRMGFRLNFYLRNVLIKFNQDVPSGITTELTQLSNDYFDFVDNNYDSSPYKTDISNIIQKIKQQITELQNRNQRQIPTAPSVEEAAESQNFDSEMNHAMSLDEEEETFYYS